MSKIASSGDFGVNLRKCIDYFCHLAKEPKFFDQIREVDEEFRNTEYFQKISWLKDENDDLEPMNKKSLKNHLSHYKNEYSVL